MQLKFLLVLLLALVAMFDFAASSSYIICPKGRKLVGGRCRIVRRPRIRTYG